jgi:hypothetical protein
MRLWFARLAGTREVLRGVSLMVSLALARGGTVAATDPRPGAT